MAGKCGVQLYFVDFVRGKFAGTIDCLLSFVYFSKPGLSATLLVQLFGEDLLQHVMLSTSSTCPLPEETMVDGLPRVKLFAVQHKYF